MVLYPNVMRKAQNEIDSVVGRDRLPSFSDQDELPYVRAMVKEVLRWRPVAPLGDLGSYFVCLVLLTFFLSRFS